VDQPGDHRGVHEDAGADDAAHHDHGDIEEPETPGERGCGGRGARQHAHLYQVRRNGWASVLNTTRS
jgi:hypothetical protein